MLDERELTGDLERIARYERGREGLELLSSQQRSRITCRLLHHSITRVCGISASLLRYAANASGCVLLLLLLMSAYDERFDLVVERGGSLVAALELNQRDTFA